MSVSSCGFCYISLGFRLKSLFLNLYRLSFCCLPFACILLAFCLLAFSFVAILHCCAFPFSDFFFSSVLLPALLSDLSFTVIFLAVLPCDDLDYPYDFPTVSAPPVQLIYPCANHDSGLPNRRSGRSSCSDHGIISPSNM